MKRKFRLSSVIILLLIVILIITTVRAVIEFRSYNSRHYDTDYLTDLVRMHDYPYLNSSYYRSGECFGGESDAHSSHWAVMRYYNDALFHKAYEEHGDTERAARYLEKMQQDSEKMGVFSSETEEIDKFLSRFD